MLKKSTYKVISFVTFWKEALRAAVQLKKHIFVFSCAAKKGNVFCLFSLLEETDESAHTAFLTLWLY